jgi:hypothetical protein
MKNEGGDSWSPFDVIGHLVYAEKTNWIPRMNIILNSNENKTFPVFNRLAQFQESKGKTLNQLLNEFMILRNENLAILKSRNINAKMLTENGMHPEFGEVTLQQLLATWIVHDLSHLSQITRVMAKQYKEEVGPWIAYLSILRKT